MFFKFHVYTGKSVSGATERNQGARVVMDLTEGLRGPRNVTCDNFFTSYELPRRLLHERRLTVVGTMRKNKTELPRALLDTKGRAVFSSKFAFTPTVTLVSYVHKRNSNRKRCQLFPRTKDRKTHTMCGACKRYICRSCTRTYCAECVRP